MAQLSALAAALVPEHGALGVELGLWTVLPFAGLLLAIALLPVVAPAWWDQHRNKALVAALFGVPIALYLALACGPEGRAVLGEKVKDYVSFTVLLAALFTISSGIYVRGSLAGTPLSNTCFLGLGAVLANLIGTTGASVLLVRPLLRANERREDKAHVLVFFVFVVSNCGGLLTPLGDPPLFLGFLRGVPFAWTLSLWKVWLAANVALLVAFNVIDQLALTREEVRRPGSQLEQVREHDPLGLEGAHNALFLLGVIACIHAAGRGWLNGGRPWAFGVCEASLVALAAAAYATTRPALREKNHASFAPIAEVALLFAGVFLAMAPALEILNAWGAGRRDVAGVPFGLSEPWHYFWATGSLSSFLDNAPTYLTFAATASGALGIPAEGPFLGELIARGPAAERVLAAISCGAVLMGAITYIGNGPNLMVRAIAEARGVRMPSFFGYMAWSGAVLLPLFALLTLMFFL
jgi:Na+/H+ antiporter NhaD/arsenite permease-like protein